MSDLDSAMMLYKSQKPIPDPNALDAAMEQYKKQQYILEPDDQDIAKMKVRKYIKDIVPNFPIELTDAEISSMVGLEITDQPDFQNIWSKMGQSYRAAMHEHKISQIGAKLLVEGRQQNLIEELRTLYESVPRYSGKGTFGDILKGAIGFGVDTAMAVPEIAAGAGSGFLLGGPPGALTGATAGYALSMGKKVAGRSMLDMLHMVDQAQSRDIFADVSKEQWTEAVTIAAGVGVASTIINFLSARISLAPIQEALKKSLLKTASDAAQKTAAGMASGKGPLWFARFLKNVALRGGVNEAAEEFSEAVATDFLQNIFASKYAPEHVKDFQSILKDAAYEGFISFFVGALVQVPSAALDARISSHADNPYTQGRVIRKPANAKVSQQPDIPMAAEPDPIKAGEARSQTTTHDSESVAPEFTDHKALRDARDADHSKLDRWMGAYKAQPLKDTPLSTDFHIKLASLFDKAHWYNSKKQGSGDRLLSRLNIIYRNEIIRLASASKEVVSAPMFQEQIANMLMLRRDGSISAKIPNEKGPGGARPKYRVTNDQSSPYDGKGILLDREFIRSLTKEQGDFDIESTPIAAGIVRMVEERIKRAGWSANFLRGWETFDSMLKQAEADPKTTYEFVVMSYERWLGQTGLGKQEYLQTLKRILDIQDGKIKPTENFRVMVKTSEGYRTVTQAILDKETRKAFKNLNKFESEMSAVSRKADLLSLEHESDTQVSAVIEDPNFKDILESYTEIAARYKLLTDKNPKLPKPPKITNKLQKYLTNYKKMVQLYLSAVAEMKEPLQTKAKKYIDPIKELREDALKSTFDYKMARRLVLVNNDFTTHFPQLYAKKQRFLHRVKAFDGLVYAMFDDTNAVKWKANTIKVEAEKKKEAIFGKVPKEIASEINIATIQYLMLLEDYKKGDVKKISSLYGKNFKELAIPDISSKAISLYFEDLYTQFAEIHKFGVEKGIIDPFSRIIPYITEGGEGMKATFDITDQVGYRLNIGNPEANKSAIKDAPIEFLLAQYYSNVHSSYEINSMIDIGSKVSMMDGRFLFEHSPSEGYKNINVKGFTQRIEVPKNRILNENNVIKIEQKDGTIKYYKEAGIYAPESLADFFNNALGKNIFEKDINESGMPKSEKLARLYMAYGAWRKQMELIYSLFHNFALMASAIYPTKGNPLSKLVNIKKMYRAGMQMGADHSNILVQYLAEGGLTFNIGVDYTADMKILRGHQAQNLLGLEKIPVIKEFATGFRKGMDQWSHFVFNKWGAGLKVFTAVNDLKLLMEQFPDTDPKFLARQVAELINDDFGGLDLRRMGVNQNFALLVRGLFMAPDWTISNTNTVVKMFDRGKDQNFIRQHIYRQFWINSITKIAAISVLMNGAFAVAAGMIDGGEFEDVLKELRDNYADRWKQGIPRGLSSIFEVDITLLYRALGLYDGRRRRTSIARQFDDILDLMFNQIGYFSGKGNFALKDAIEIMTGTDIRGRRFATFQEMLEKGDTGVWGRSTPLAVEQIPAYLIYWLGKVMPSHVDGAVGVAYGYGNWMDAFLQSSGIGVKRGPQE